MAETNDDATGHDSPVSGGGLIDLSDAPLHELLRREDDTALAQALRRIAIEASRKRGDAVSSFGSSMF
jgi:hypothetical protein